MLPDAGKFTVIETGTAQLAIIDFKTQRMNQVQGTAGIGTKAYDVTGVRWYLGLVKNNVKHLNKDPCDSFNRR